MPGTLHVICLFSFYFYRNPMVGVVGWGAVIMQCFPMNRHEGDMICSDVPGERRSWWGSISLMQGSPLSHFGGGAQPQQEGERRLANVMLV